MLILTYLKTLDLGEEITRPSVRGTVYNPQLVESADTEPWIWRVNCTIMVRFSTELGVAIP